MEEKIMNNLKTGSFLQALRKTKGLTQADLAEYFEVSAKTVSKWECGDSLPEIPMLKALADFYDVSVDEILNGEKKEGKEGIKTRQANENYFYNNKIRKLNFALILSLCILALGYIMIYILGYTTNRSDIGGWVSISIEFISAVAFAFGIFIAGSLDNDFSDELKKSYKRRRLWYIYSFVFSFIFAFVCALLFAELPPIRNAVLTLSSFLWTNFIVLSVVLAVASLLPFILLVMKYQGNKKTAIIFSIVYYVLSLCVLLHAFFAYYLQEKTIEKVVFPNDYNYFIYLNVSWMYWFGIFLLFVSLAVFILSVWKKKSYLYSMFVQTIGIVFLFVAISDAQNDESHWISNGVFFEFQSYLVYALILFGILALIEIGTLIYRFTKRDKKIKTA